MIQEAADPWTVRTIEATNPRAVLRCLEVGGGGSMANRPCQRVDATGHVVATDLEFKSLSSIQASNLEVRRHNIVSDPPEEDHYDLIQARAVLDQFPERDEVIPGLVAALRPGGWLTIEAGLSAWLRAAHDGGAIGDRIRRPAVASAPIPKVRSLTLATTAAWPPSATTLDTSSSVGVGARWECAARTEPCGRR